MCEAGDREQVVCDKLFKIIQENGHSVRCSYHEEITTGLANVRGSLKALWWIIGLGVGVLIGMQSTSLWFIVEHISK